MKKILGTAVPTDSLLVPVSVLHFQEMSHIHNKGVVLLVYAALEDLEEGIKYLFPA